MKRYLNLITDKAKTRLSVRRCVRRWLVVTAIALLCLAQVGVTRWWSYQGAAQARATAEARFDPIRQLKLENAKYKQQIEYLEDNEQVSIALAKNQPVLVLLGLVGQAVSETKQQLCVQQLEFHQDPLAANAAGKPSGKLALEGVSLHGDAITLFTDQLREAIPFAEIDVESTETIEMDEWTKQIFSLTLSF